MHFPRRQCVYLLLECSESANSVRARLGGRFLSVLELESLGCPHLQAAIPPLSQPFCTISPVFLSGGSGPYDLDKMDTYGQGLVRLPFFGLLVRCIGLAGPVFTVGRSTCFVLARSLLETAGAKC